MANVLQTKADAQCDKPMTEIVVTASRLMLLNNFDFVIDK